jgi:hypothetical protein
MCEPPDCCDYEYEPPYCGYESEQMYLTGDINRNLYVDYADLEALINRWLSED